VARRRSGGASERFEPVTADHAADLDALFATGDPRDCQCAFVRLSNADWAAAAPPERRAVHLQAIAAATVAGRAAGLLAYRDDVPVGWVSFDVREAYGRLSSSSLLRPVDDRAVWSVVCFVVAAKARRTGLAGRLLDEAIAYARAHGARLLEAYPIDTSAPTGSKRSSADLWRGTVSMFEAAGFRTVEVRRRSATGPPTPIMRRAIRRSRT
jgi:GNAT superfamily N-acetyltransferase